MEEKIQLVEDLLMISGISEFIQLMHMFIIPKLNTKETTNITFYLGDMVSLFITLKISNIQL